VSENAHLPFDRLIVLSRVEGESREIVENQIILDLPPKETMSQFDKTVIPGEQNNAERDPQSRRLSGNQVTLDPGSHPAPRDLAGMTKWDIASPGRNSSLDIK
jgi:hypothetical protein